MLDEALMTLAAAAGTAVVQAASTDAWTGFREAVARLLGRENEQRASIALERLDETAAALAAADERGNELVAARREGFWEAGFRDLLESVGETERESVGAQLRALIEEHAAPTSANRDQFSGNTFNGPTAIQTGDNNRQENRFGTGT